MENQKEEKEMTKVEVLENRNINKNFQKYYKGKCQGLTKTGKQCGREAVGSKYCWQHQVEEN